MALTLRAKAEAALPAEENKEELPFPAERTRLGAGGGYKGRE
jgi:hypothetical protein